MKPKASILAVDRNPRNLQLLAEFLGREGIATATATTIEEVDAVLAEDSPITVALLDFAGFDNSMWRRCERLRTRNVPFVVISARPNDALAHTSIRLGARGMLVKPLSKPALLQLIEGSLRDNHGSRASVAGSKGESTPAGRVVVNEVSGRSGNGRRPTGGEF